MNPVVVFSVSRTGLCVTLAVCFVCQGTMPLFVRAKHRCKEPITEMNLQYILHIIIFIPALTAYFGTKNKLY